MNGTDVGVIIGVALAGFVALAVVVGMRRRGRSTLAPSPRPAAAPRPDAQSAEGTRACRPRPVKDRRSLWAKRYGAGSAWTAAAWTAGSGLHLTQKKDGVGDPVAACSGSAGMIGGCGAGAACGGGVSCGGGGFSGGGGCGGGCGGGGCGGGGCGGGGCGGGN
jgi:hypothetical protein